MSDITTINGGENCEVELRGGTERETVFVRQIPIREMPKFAGLVGDEAALIEFVCAKEEGWADRLTVAAHETLLQKVEEINRDPFERWMARRGQALERLQAAVPKNLASLMPSAPSASGSA